MPVRTCQICQQQHAIIKMYGYGSPGLYEHVVIEDPAQSRYCCELCRSCICQGCGRSCVRPPDQWRKHLLLTDSRGTFYCQECTSTRASHGNQQTLDTKAAFARLIQQRVQHGGGPQCPTCVALFMACGQQTPEPLPLQAPHPSGSRFSTVPLMHQPGQLLNDAAGATGHTTRRSSWPAADASAGASQEPGWMASGQGHHGAADVMPSAPCLHDSNTGIRGRSFGSDGRQSVTSEMKVIEDEGVVMLMSKWKD